MIRAASRGDEATLDTLSQDDYGERFDERRQMVDGQIRARGIRDPQVLQVFYEVPRHWFVPADQQALAYADQALPIGQGQTISQPYIVALMTEALMAASDARVLEIGTGSGYQAAILSRLVAHVYTVERYESLAGQALERFGRLGYQNISVRVGDGTLGWPDYAPYDDAIITAAGPSIPTAIIAQIRPGGIVVLPIGRRRSQRLRRLWIREAGYISENLGRVSFVPLVGRYGWKSEWRPPQ